MKESSKGILQTIVRKLMAEHQGRAISVPEIADSLLSLHPNIVESETKRLLLSALGAIVRQVIATTKPTEQLSLSLDDGTPNLKYRVPIRLNGKNKRATWIEIESLEYRYLLARIDQLADKGKVPASKKLERDTLMRVKSEVDPVAKGESSSETIGEMLKKLRTKKMG